MAGANSVNVSYRNHFDIFQGKQTGWSAFISFQTTSLLPIPGCVFKALISSYYAGRLLSSFANLPWSPGIKVKAMRPNSLEAPTESKWIAEKSELGLQDFLNNASQPEPEDLSEKSHRTQHRILSSLVPIY